MHKFKVIAPIKNMVNGSIFSVEQTVHAMDKYHALINVIDGYEQISFLIWHREHGCSVTKI